MSDESVSATGVTATDVIATDKAPLTQAEIAEIEHEISHLPDRKSAAIDALKIVQQHRGWVSDDALAATAALLGMSVAELDGIATFYNLIYRKPVGKTVILFCDSVSCWLMGGDRVCEKLRESLGVDYGGTTSDNRFTLLPVTCLGDCDHAPAMMVGEELYDNLTLDNVMDFLAWETLE